MAEQCPKTYPPQKKSLKQLEKENKKTLKQKNNEEKIYFNSIPLKDYKFEIKEMN